MKKTAIIGSGATAIYLLKHILDNQSILKKEISSISIFEKGTILGMGMPYNPNTTDLYNLSNISSEELPELPISFERWLKKQKKSTLENLSINKYKIDKSEVYNRLSLGKYFQAQYNVIIKTLTEEGIEVIEYPNTEIIDIDYNEITEKVTLQSSNNLEYIFGKVFIATGHTWNKEDNPKNGYFSSPWPISKIINKEDTFHNFTIGTLGASLSAFDVVSSLSRRHGEFIADASGNLSYQGFKGTEKFKIVMHAANGWLPHLQYEQENPMRKIYRHLNREDIYSILDDEGFLRIETYFNTYCRKALLIAFRKDKMGEMEKKLKDKKYTFSNFVEDMSQKHEYRNAFEGMRLEMKESKKSVDSKKPIHWKEVIDDLMYTLNFHAELMPAEDHLYFHKEVMPFLMNVIAAMPINSGKILLALFDANKIAIISGHAEVLNSQKNDCTTVQVKGGNSEIAVNYRMFIDCTGQNPVTIENYPFQSLVKRKFINSAKVAFKDAMIGREIKASEKYIEKINDVYYYILKGINVDAGYSILDKNNNAISAIQDLTFTHITGLRPYAYGLQACSAISEILISTWVQSLNKNIAIEGNLEEVTLIYEDNPKL